MYAKPRSPGWPQSRRRAWPQERRACSGGLTRLSVGHPVCHRSPQPSYVALSAAVPPGHPCSAPLPHPATPVQHQPTSRSTAELPGRSGFREAWSRARRPGGWPMENVDARCHVWSGILPPTRATKKRTWTSPLCRRLPVCAVSGCVWSAARSGSSCSCVWCCDRTIVYRRHAISGREQTSSQFWWCPAIALRLSRSLNVSHIWTHPALQGQCCLMALST